MPRKPCYWTRKLELELVEFIQQREFIWKPVGNTNHHIQQKYKAYAEFAARLGRGFTGKKYYVLFYISMAQCNVT